MVVLDRFLGLAELILIPVSLILLVTALYKEKGRRRAVIVTLITGLTVAQPFGIVSHAEQSVPPASAESVDPKTVHAARVLGVPVLPFKLYTRTNLLHELQETTTSETLRARSWFWGPFLTNSTEIADTCGGSPTPPCAGTLDRKLRMLSDDGDYWITVANPSACRPAAGIPCSFTWKVGVGVTSWIGLAYWVVAGALLVPVLRRLRSERFWGGVGA